MDCWSLLPSFLSPLSPSLLPFPSLSFFLSFLPIVSRQDLIFSVVSLVFNSLSHPSMPTGSYWTALAVSILAV